MQSLRSFGPASVVAAGVLALAAPASSADRDVSIVNFKFVPAVIAVDAGDNVTWTNNGAAPHDTVSGKPEDPDPGELWDSGLMSPGDTFSRTFDAPDTSDYHCSFHPTQMFGKVYVNGTGVQGTMIPTDTTITSGKINTTAYLLNFGGGQDINVQLKVRAPNGMMKTVVDKDLTLGANKRVQKALSITIPNGLPNGIYHVILEVRDSGGNVLSSDDDLFNKFVQGREEASLKGIKAESPNAAWASYQN
jgi:plastocyanin